MSSNRLFGTTSVLCEQTCTDTATRWRQRALYDYMKDQWAVDKGIRLVRLSVHDVVGEVSLGALLSRDADSDEPEPNLLTLIQERTLHASS